MRNIIRLLKATALVVGSYYAGNIIGGIAIVLWGWQFAGFASVVGICAAVVQGITGVTVFETLVKHFKLDASFRFRVAAVMAWGTVGATLLVAVLQAWMFGIEIDDALAFAASIVASAPWCYWTTNTVLESRRASLAMAV